MYVGVNLAQAPLGTDLVLLDAPEHSRQRLSCLGLRIGSQFSLLGNTAGGGRVAMVRGSRIALGATLLTQLWVETTR